MKPHIALAVLAIAGCKAANPTLSEPIVTHRLEPVADTQTGRPEPTEVQEVDEPEIEHANRYLAAGRPNRLTLLLATTEEEGDTDRTGGIEFEHLIHPNWGVGGLVDYFQGHIDEYLVAASLIFHPVHQVGFAVNPGVQFRDGESDRLAVRTGMFYDFEVTKSFSLGPVIYIDFLEGGTRSNILGVALNLHF